MAFTGQLQNSSPAAGSLAGVATPALTKRPRWWTQLFAIAWLAWVYDAINSLAPVRQRIAEAHARGILSLEHSLHLSPELALNRWLAAKHTLGVIVTYYYDDAHFVVTFGLLGYLWYRRADLYRPLRDSLVLINVIGFVIFWRYPVAPPRMLAGAGFTDVIANSHTFLSWHTGKLATDANQLAAMPSLHLAWASWSSLAMWRLSKRRWLRVVAVSYPFVTMWAVLSTGNHFLVDVLAGLATTLVSVLCVKAADALLARWRLSRAQTGTGSAPT
jgi:hypothetical protein